jgi:hypothetical protein
MTMAEALITAAPNATTSGGEMLRLAGLGSAVMAAALLVHGATGSAVLSILSPALLLGGLAMGRGSRAWLLTREDAGASAGVAETGPAGPWEERYPTFPCDRND